MSEELADEESPFDELDIDALLDDAPDDEELQEMLERNL